jgi:cytochrome P450
MATGTQTQQVISDLEYDWLTVMHNKAKAMQAYDQYIQDARTANSQECADFFSQLKQTEAQQIQEIRQHLMKTMSNR